MWHLNWNLYWISLMLILVVGKTWNELNSDIHRMSIKKKTALTVILHVSLSCHSAKCQVVHCEHVMSLWKHKGATMLRQQMTEFPPFHSVSCQTSSWTSRFVFTADRRNQWASSPSVAAALCFTCCCCCWCHHILFSATLPSPPPPTSTFIPPPPPPPPLQADVRKAVKTRWHSPRSLLLVNMPTLHLHSTHPPPVFAFFAQLPSSSLHLLTPPLC